MNRKLLLADENVTTRRVIELMFASENVDVVAVNDGEQAIQRILMEKPDIVLADIGTSKRSGYEVAAFVRQHADLSHLPVVLLAGAFEPVDEERARQVRSDGVLVKPFEPHQVVARVRELLESRRPAAREPAVGTGENRFVDPGALLADTGSRVTGPESRSPGRQFGSLGPESPVPNQESPVPDSEPTSLDDYFERLDAAFTARGSSRSQPPPGSPIDDLPPLGRVPTIEDILGGASRRAQSDPFASARVAPPEAPSTPAPSPGPPRVASPRNPLAHAFTLLLSVEQGELDRDAIRIGTFSPGFEITDELVDRVTRRVLERLAPGAARNLVSEIVSEIAERLVHEEIQRTRKA